MASSVSITITSAGAPCAKGAAGQSEQLVPAAPTSHGNDGNCATSPECTNHNPAASIVSRLIAPAAASANGRRLVSTSCGL